ncbi:hypothetical protein PFISCL1PPCAC_20691, partial [Pristionchus fissidentatus]
SDFDSPTFSMLKGWSCWKRWERRLWLADRKWMSSLRQLAEATRNRRAARGRRSCRRGRAAAARYGPVRACCCPVLAVAQKLKQWNRELSARAPIASIPE